MLDGVLRPGRITKEAVFPALEGVPRRDAFQAELQEMSFSLGKSHFKGPIKQPKQLDP